MTSSEIAQKERKSDGAFASSSTTRAEGSVAVPVAIVHAPRSSIRPSSYPT
jgi:hypothetical protein